MSKRSKAQTQTSQAFWCLPTDDVQVIDDCGEKILRFKVHGHPQPLRRHRQGRKGLYNPSSRDQQLFKAALIQRLSQQSVSECVPKPFFLNTDHLSMTIIFHFARPRSHCVGKHTVNGCLPLFCPPLRSLGERR